MSTHYVLVTVNYVRKHQVTMSPIVNAARASSWEANSRYAIKPGALIAREASTARVPDSRVRRSPALGRIVPP